jgi:hypothetical protein
MFLQALRKLTFRSLDQGRGVGVAAALGRTKAEEVIGFIYALNHERPKVSDRSTGLLLDHSQGMGLRHFVADLFLLHLSPDYLSDFVDRTNQRVLSGYLRSVEYSQSFEYQDVIRRNMEDVLDRSSDLKLSPIYPGTLIHTWCFLTARYERN